MLLLSRGDVGQGGSSQLSMMAAWGLFVAVALAIGSLPFFAGLAVVSLPVLAHSTWHLHRKLVEPDLEPASGPPPPSERTALGVADFPAVLLPGTHEDEP